jgi:hypothetical protein
MGLDSFSSYLGLKLMLLLDSYSSYYSDIFIKSMSKFLILLSSSSDETMELSKGAGFKLIIYLGSLYYAF